MASVFTGPRSSQARRLVAFVASFVLVAGLLGTLAPEALSAGAQPAQIVGPNSCIGEDACAGATGSIGANSCNGYHACYQADGAGASVSRLVTITSLGDGTKQDAVKFTVEIVAATGGELR